MRPAPERLLSAGIRLIAAFEHTGAAEDLVHHLKYRGITDYAELVTSVLAPRLPALPLVPIPRSWTRRIRYGVDPARTLATRISARMGSPLIDLLEPPLHSPRRAGGNHRRAVGDFRLRASPPASIILVDDVVTTGATAEAAARSIGTERVQAVIAANAVVR